MHLSWDSDTLHFTMHLWCQEILVLMIRNMYKSSMAVYSMICKILTNILKQHYFLRSTKIHTIMQQTCILKFPLMMAKLHLKLSLVLYTECSLSNHTLELFLPDAWVLYYFCNLVKLQLFEERHPCLCSSCLNLEEIRQKSDSTYTSRVESIMESGHLLYHTLFIH